MKAYYDSLIYMMILMFILFVFSLPAMNIYSKHNALRNENMYMFTKYSLGNLGGSQTVCTTAPIDSTYLPMSCKSGVMRAEEAKFGIIPESAPQQNICLNNHFT